MAVAAYQDLDVRPMPADAGDDIAPDLGDFLPRWTLARPQEGENGLARETVEDVDLLEARAVVVVVRVEQRELLLAVHGIVISVLTSASANEHLFCWCPNARELTASLFIQT
jgi:broad specificity phosphatase PhoE